MLKKIKFQVLPALCGYIQYTKEGTIMSKIDKSEEKDTNRQEMICKIVKILQHANMREVTLTYMMLAHLGKDPAKE